MYPYHLTLGNIEQHSLHQGGASRQPAPKIRPRYEKTTNWTKKPTRSDKDLP